MRKFLCGFICGAIIFSSTAYAYRAPRPHQMTMPWTDNQVVELNNILEDFWNITNGRVNLDIESTAPTVAGDEGDVKAFSDGTNYRLYIYINNGWRIFSDD